MNNCNCCSEINNGCLQLCFYQIDTLTIKKDELLQVISCISHNIAQIKFTVTIVLYNKQAPF